MLRIKNFLKWIDKKIISNRILFNYISVITILLLFYYSKYILNDSLTSLIDLFYHWIILYSFPFLKNNWLGYIFGILFYSTFVLMLSLLIKTKLRIISWLLLFIYLFLYFPVIHLSKIGL